MKNFLLLFLLLGVCVFADSVHWYSNFNKGLEAAQASKKTIVLFIEQDNCRYCDYLKSTVYQDEEVIEKLNSNFIPIKLNTQRHPIPRYLLQDVAPVTWFLSRNGKPLFKPILGASYDTEQMIDALDSF